MEEEVRQLLREEIIRKVFPYYFLDYQEVLSDDPDTRWSHRISLDGTWEGNLFQYTQKVYSRLVDNLDIPFKVNEDSVRIDESNIHEALREALVNTVIHADHSSSKSIKIIRNKNYFSFFNPGRLRVPLRKLYQQGGVTDCRNPSLQRMFGFVGWGERAGSGFQKILKTWQSQHWTRPFIFEDLELEATVVMLSLVSVIPERISKDLLQQFGSQFINLTELERSLLILTATMGHSKNETLQQYRQEHPSDMTKALGKLVDHGFLEADGKGRGTFYKIAIKSQSFEHLDEKSIDFNKLWDSTEDIRKKAKCPKTLIESRILEICSSRFVSLRLLGKLLNRDFDTLRNHYINPLIKENRLAAKYPDKQRHPNQAYRAV